MGLLLIIYLVIGGHQLIQKLLTDERLSKQKSAVEGLEDMKLLLRYCELYGILDKVCLHNFTLFLGIVLILL
jgi:hypothetical protein